MGQQWKQRCKDCGKEFGYSDLSLQLDQQKGMSRPERCAEHRKQHAHEVNAISASHFSLKPNPEKGSILGTMFIGEVRREERPLPVAEFMKPDDKIEENIGIKEKHLRRIYDALDKDKKKVLVIVAPTGSGKSTFLPKSLLYPIGFPVDHFTKHGPIVMTQPRVLATSGVANAIAEKFIGADVGPGHDVGFSHGNKRSRSTRREDCEMDIERIMDEAKAFTTDKLVSGEFYDRRNRLQVVTDGKLINRIADGSVNEYGIVFIDEAHERSCNIDFILSAMRNELIKYEHLKLIIASATIDAEAFCGFFEKDLPTALIDLSEECGKTVGYEEKEWIFSELTKEELDGYDEEKSKSTLKAYEKKVINKMADKIFEVYKEIQNGDILGFLHGSKEIDQCIEVLTLKFGNIDNVQIYPLHASLSEHDQKEYLKPPEKRQIKRNASKPPRIIYIGTNIAETSLTFPDLVSVVDSGLIKQTFWDPRTCREELRAMFHSKDGCKQRWGRVGRNQQGYVYRLYTKAEFIKCFQRHTTPEIARSNMEDVIIKANASGLNNIADPSCIKWLAAPDETEVRRAKGLFKSRGLTDEDADFTAHGREVYKLSNTISGILGENEPLLKRAMDSAALLILADRYGCLIEAATFVAMMPHLGRESFAMVKKKENGEKEPKGTGAFLWDHAWDMRSKYIVSRLYHELKAGCLDDLDLSCKLLALHLKEVSRADDWKETYKVNEGNLDKARDERAKLLQSFTKGTKEGGGRNIDFGKVPILRFLVSIAWPDRRRTIRKEGDRFIMLDEEGDENDAVKGLLSDLSAFKSFDDGHVIAGLFSNSEIDLNQGDKGRGSPVGSVLVKYMQTGLSVGSSMYDILTHVRGLKAEFNFEKTMSRLFAHLQAPFNSKVSNGLVQERAGLFVPTTVDGSDTEPRGQGGTPSDVPQIPFNVSPPNESGHVRQWSVGEDGIAVCHLGSGPDGVLAWEQRPLSVETLECELQEPVYELPTGRLAGFIAKDSTGSIRAVSSRNLSIHQNNPVLNKYAGSPIRFDVLPQHKNIHEDFRLSLLRTIDEGWREIQDKRVFKGYVSEMLPNKAQIILESNGPCYHACDHRWNLSDLKEGQEFFFFIKEYEDKHWTYDTRSEIMLSDVHVKLLKKFALNGEDGGTLISGTKPITYDGFIETLKGLPFGYHQLRGIYSQGRSIRIDKFIALDSDFMKEIRAKYLLLSNNISTGDEGSKGARNQIFMFIEENKKNCPKLLKDFIYSNLRLSKNMIDLKGKESTLSRWTSNLRIAKNELERNKLIEKIQRISQEISSLKTALGGQSRLPDFPC